MIALYISIDWRSTSGRRLIAWTMLKIFPALPSALYQVRKFIREEAEEAGLSPPTVNDVILAAVTGAVLGAALLAVLRNGLVILGVSSFVQTALTGLVIIAAIAVNVVITSRRRTWRMRRGSLASQTQVSAAPWRIFDGMCRCSSRGPDATSFRR